MFTIQEILKATGGRLIQGEQNRRVCAVSVDSRTIKPNELFVAIRGRRFNGHRFIAQAKKKHAGAILFSNRRYLAKTKLIGFGSSTPMIRVEDTTCALGELAHYYRTRFKIPVIAITGSNGKTTTKEMLKSLLSKRFRLLCNPGTQNNHIGLPLTIFKLRKSHNLAIVELGANHAGEIDRLSWIAQPTVGIITNIGPAHLKSFRNLEGVFKAKIELIKNLARNGKLVINQDDRFLAQLQGRRLQIITFGLNRCSDFSGQILKQTDKNTTFLLNNRYNILLKALGRHNVYNALASIAVARNFGLSFNEIKQSLSSLRMPPMRMQMLNINNIKLINDCYNSNPQSLGCALEFLKDCSNGRRNIVVCGDMLELGRSKDAFHIEIGKMIAKYEIDFLITVGPLAKNIACAAHLAGMSKKLIRTFGDSCVAGKFLRTVILPRDIVLIKGSRAMRMENILECFTGSFTH